MFKSIAVFKLVVYLYKKQGKTSTMKTKHFKPIFKKLYTVTIVKNNEINSIGMHELSFTNHASFCLKNTAPEILAPQLELIAKRNNIDLMEYGQFDYCFDLLRHSVSWN